MLQITNPDLIHAAKHSLRALESCTEEKFLTGGARRVVVDEIFATPLSSVLLGFLSDAGYDAMPLPQSLSSLATLTPEAEIVFGDAQGCDGELGYGILALNLTQNRYVGAYTGCSLAVDSEFRDQGIGRALVMLRYLRDAELPLWSHDKPSYSTAGYATHVSAYATLRAWDPNTTQ